MTEHKDESISVLQGIFVEWLGLVMTALGVVFALIALPFCIWLHQPWVNLWASLAMIAFGVVTRILGHEIAKEAKRQGQWGILSLLRDRK